MFVMHVTTKHAGATGGFSELAAAQCPNAEFRILLIILDSRLRTLIAETAKKEPFYLLLFCN